MPLWLSPTIYAYDAYDGHDDYDVYDAYYGRDGVLCYEKKHVTLAAMLCLLCLMFRSPSPPFVADLPTANPPPSSTGREAGARVPRRGGGVLQRPVRQRMRQRPRRGPGSLGSLGWNEGFLGIFWDFFGVFGNSWFQY